MLPAPKRGALPTAIWAMRSGLHPVVVERWGKAPIGKAWGLQTPTRERLLKLYEEHPGAGVGLLLGPASGVVDLEIDDTELAAPLLEQLDLPPTLGWTSARGGHRLFRWTKELGELGDTATVHVGGLELRKGGEGKQLHSVIPPSVGDNRRKRLWNGVWEVAEAPAGFLKLLDFLPRKELPIRKPCHVPQQENMTHRYAAAALRYESNAVRLAKEGTRNRTLNRAAFSLGQLVAAGLIERRVVEMELLDAGLDSGLGELETLATIKSGIEAGLEKPRR